MEKCSVVNTGVTCYVMNVLFSAYIGLHLKLIVLKYLFGSIRLWKEMYFDTLI